MKGFILSGAEQTLKKEQLLRRIGSMMGSGRFPRCMQNLPAKGGPPYTPEQLRAATATRPLWTTVSTELWFTVPQAFLV